MSELDYKRMVEEIDKIVNNEDFGNLELSLMPKSKPYTQKEAGKMMKMLGQVYRVAHCVTCTACARRYMIKDNK